MGEPCPLFNWADTEGEILCVYFLCAFKVGKIHWAI